MTEEDDLVFESGETQHTWERRRALQWLDEFFDDPLVVEFNNLFMMWCMKYVFMKRSTEDIMREWRLD